MERLIMAQRNSDLRAAKAAKNDEFYTQYEDIEEEMSYYLEYDPDVFRDKTILLPCDDPEYSEFTKYFVANFEAFGIKKLISTSYAHSACNQKVTEFEKRSKNFDAEKHATHGKVFVLERDVDKNKKIDIDDLAWNYLEGDGDFRSDEVKALRDEADFIITNEPFSLFRNFISWIFDAPTEKKFIIIGNINAITYKEIFPLIKDNKLWFGESIHSGDRKFYVPDDYPLNAAGCGVDENGRRYIRVKGVRWFTNTDHGGRHKEYQYMSMADNLRYNKKLIKALKTKFNMNTYPKYDNYDAIEIPYSDAIPIDYEGAMGVPITYLDRHNSDQFEILDCNDFKKPGVPFKAHGLIKDKEAKIGDCITYARILIKRKQRPKEGE